MRALTRVNDGEFEDSEEARPADEGGLVQEPLGESVEGDVGHFSVQEPRHGFDAPLFDQFVVGQEALVSLLVTAD